MVKFLKKKDSRILTGAYALFLFSLIFSKYDANSSLNGTSGISRFVYFGGLIVFFLSFVYVYYSYMKRNEHDAFRRLSFTNILLFMFFFIAILGARSAIRLIMVLGPPAAIIISYFAVSLIFRAREEKDETYRIVVYAIMILVVSSFCTLVGLWLLGSEHRGEGDNSRWRKCNILLEPPRGKACPYRN
jgi:hypothetical protein